MNRQARQSVRRIWATPVGPNNTGDAVKFVPAAMFPVSLSARSDVPRECNGQCIRPNWSENKAQTISPHWPHFVRYAHQNATHILHAKIECLPVAFRHFVSHPQKFVIFENPIFRCIILEYFQALRYAFLNGHQTERYKQRNWINIEWCRDYGDIRLHVQWFLSEQYQHCIDKIGRQIMIKYHTEHMLPVAGFDWTIWVPERKA